MERKTMRSCRNCQRSHQRCGKVLWPKRSNKILFHFIHYGEKLLTWFLDNLLPCTRCIKRGISHTCVEGTRKKPQFIQYLVKKPRSVSSDCKSRDFMTGEEHKSNSSQSKPIVGVSGPDRIVHDKSVLHGPEYNHVRSEDVKIQPSSAVPGNNPVASHTQRSNLDTRVHGCRSLSCTARTSEVSDRGVQYCEQTFPTWSAIHETQTCENTSPLYVHPGSLHMFPDQTLPRGFTVPSGWANTFLYPD